MSVSLEQRSALFEPSSEVSIFTEIQDPVTIEFLQDLDAVLEDEGTPIAANTLAAIIHEDYQFGHPEPYNIGAQILSAVKREHALSFTPIQKGKRETPGFDRETALAFGLLCEIRGRFYPATTITDFELIRERAIKQAGKSRLASILSSTQSGSQISTIQTDVEVVSEQVRETEASVRWEDVTNALLKLHFFEAVAHDSLVHNIYEEVLTENEKRKSRGDRPLNVATAIERRLMQASERADQEGRQSGEVQVSPNGQVHHAVNSDVEGTNGTNGSPQLDHLSGENHVAQELVTVFVAPQTTYEALGDLNGPTAVELQEVERELVTEEPDSAIVTTEKVGDEGQIVFVKEASSGEIQSTLKGWDYARVSDLNAIMIAYGHEHPVLVDSFDPLDFGVSEYVANRMEQAAVGIYKRMANIYLASIPRDARFAEKKRMFAEMFDPEYGTDTIEGYRVKVIVLIARVLGNYRGDKSLTLADFSVYSGNLGEEPIERPRRGRPPKNRDKK